MGLRDLIGADACELDAVYSCVLGRFPTPDERNALADGERSILEIAVQIVRGEEFDRDVVAALESGASFKDRFWGPPLAGFTGTCVEILDLPADMTLVATWKDWVQRLLDSDFGVAALPGGAQRLRDAADLRWRTARAWQRVPITRASFDPDPRSLRSRLITSGLFDPKWYLARNRDIGTQDPVQHFLEHGFKEGRAPSPHFDLNAYLNENPDVRQSGTNGLFHWMEHGLHEGRRAPFSKGAPLELGLRLSDLCDPYNVEHWQRESDDDFLVSVLTPTFNTDPGYLRELHTSLMNQRYDHWEWVISDDGSSRVDTIETLHEMAATDNRINLAFAKRSGGISVASNAALARARGHMVALVDHDDLLHRDAFLEVWKAWKYDPACEIFYTDECKLSLQGDVYDVYLKPGWSPVLLENTMYVAHLTVYARALIERAGGFRSAYDGTQDYDLILRASRLATHATHVDVIGYIWRAIPGSTASALDQKQWAVRRQQAAVRDHARTLAEGANVQSAFSAGHWRVTYPLPSPPPLLSYVIPTGAGRRDVWGRSVDLITNVIRSIIEHDFYPHYEFVIVHNGDLNEVQLSYIQSVPQTRLVLFNEANLNLAQKINMGVEVAAGDYVCLMNDDIEIITERGGEELIAFLSAHPDVGTIGPLCLFEDGRVQHNGVMLLEQGPSHSGIFQRPHAPSHFNYLRMRREAFGVTGALLLTRRDLYRELGGFDEGFPLNYNDVDFCQKVRTAGYSCVVDPEIAVYHFESATKVGTFKCEKEAFFRRWPTLHDPYFNKRFDQRDPSYRVPTEMPKDKREDFERWLDRRIGTRSPQTATAPSSAGPLLTVAVSVYNQPKSQLVEMLNSVLMQTYRHFELLIVDNGSSKPETLAWTESLGSHDKVRFTRLEKNAGIAGGQRALLERARGAYFLPIDADDFLTIDALAIVRLAIENNPHAEFFYSDEFKSDDHSNKFSPFFKTDYDPVKIFNCCYVGHLMTFRTAFLREISAYEDDRATWCHDWDSTMRAWSKGASPVHIPELLYAWRINAGSTASAATAAKPEAVGSQRFVLERTLASLGLADALAVEPNRLGENTGMWRVRARRARSRIAAVDAAWLWQRPFDVSFELLQMLLDQPDKPRWIAILLPGSDTDHDLKELSVPSLLDERVRVTSGILVDRHRHVIWSGGEIDGARLREPAAGQPLSLGGYHGQLFCQRCIDVAPAGNVLIGADVLVEAMARSQDDFSPAALMIEIALAAREQGWLIASTPHVEIALSSPLSCIIPVDREGRLAREKRGGSHWSNGASLREQFR